MADYCDYEIHVRGTKKAALMVYATMRSADLKEITFEGGTDDEYTLHFSSCCKWEPDAYCDKKWDGKEIDLSGIDEKSMREETGIDDFMSYSLADMSAMYHCEIEIHACYPEAESNSFFHYKDGDTLDEQWAAPDWEAAPDDIDEEEGGEEDFYPDEPREDLSTLFDF